MGPSNSIIENILVGVDRVCDYIPLVSTLTNIVDIIGKMIIGAVRHKSETRDATIEKHKYTHHLKHKHLGRCVASAIPGFGNIGIAIYDAVKSRSVKGENLNTNSQNSQHATQDNFVFPDNTTTYSIPDKILKALPAANYIGILSISSRSPKNTEIEEKIKNLNLKEGLRTHIVFITPNERPKKMRDSEKITLNNNVYYTLELNTIVIKNLVECNEDNSINMSRVEEFKSSILINN